MKQDKYIKGCAFFDVDGTIINTKSVFSFLEFSKDIFIEYNKDMFFYYYNTLYSHMDSGTSRELVNKYYYKIFKNIPVDVITEQGLMWYKKVSTYENFYNKRTISLIRQHKNNNYKIIFVTGSFKAVLNPLANDINCDHIICTEQEIKDGKYTGEIISIPCIGKGKATKINEFSLENNIDLDNCYSYGDDISDTHMINMTRHGQMILPEEAYVSQKFLIKNW